MIFNILTGLMGSNKHEVNTLKGNVNHELNVFNDQTTKHMEILPNTISSASADTEELNDKDEQKRGLTSELTKIV